jgi:uncharacterized membrane protein YadS
MVKIFRIIVIVLSLLLLVVIFLPGCNNNASATNANPIIPVFTSGLSNIKTVSKNNNIIVENINCKKQWEKFCNDLRLNYYNQ